MFSVVRLLPILLVFSMPVWADQTDPVLDDLFTRLHETTSSTEASLIQRRIWSIWYESDDPQVEALMTDGLEAMQTRKFYSAISVFSKVIKIAPDFAEGWNRRATVYYLIGQYEKSLTDVDKVLALEPRHFGAWSGAGQIYNQLERKRESMNAFRKALAVNPHMPSPRIMLERLEKDLEGDPI